MRSACAANAIWVAPLADYVQRAKVWDLLNGVIFFIKNYYGGKIKMTNLDQLKAKISDMDSQQLADLFDELSDDCCYCAIPLQNCKAECSKGFKLWLDLKLEGCSKCLCNKCNLKSGKGSCSHCIACLKEDERDVVKKCSRYKKLLQTRSISND